MRPKCKYAFWILALVGLFAVSSVAASKLTRKQAEELVLNTPDADAARARRGCPKAFAGLENDKQETLFFSVHDPCDKSGAASNKIGQYTVDLKTGEVWSGVDRRDDGKNLIDSPRMRELLKKYFALKK